MGARAGARLVPELVPVSEPEPDFVPEVPPEMAAVGVFVAPRCEASKPNRSTTAETVLSTQ